jgi:hypothetical protein
MGSQLQDDCCLKSHMHDGVNLHEGRKAGQEESFSLKMPIYDPIQSVRQIYFKLVGVFKTCGFRGSELDVEKELFPLDGVSNNLY